MGIDVHDNMVESVICYIINEPPGVRYIIHFLKICRIFKIRKAQPVCFKAYKKVRFPIFPKQMPGAFRADDYTAPVPL
jgi:hypothetical protein